MLLFGLNCTPERSSEYFRIILPDLFKTSQKANLSVLWSAAFVCLFRTAKREGNSLPEEKKETGRGTPRPVFLRFPIMMMFSKGEPASRKRTPNMLDRKEDEDTPEAGAGKARRKTVHPSMQHHSALPPFCVFPLFSVSAPERHHRSLTASCPANSTLLFVSDFPWHVESISSGVFSSGAFLLCFANLMTSFTYCG